MHPLGIPAVLLGSALGRVAQGEDGEGPLAFGDPDDLLHGAHPLLHRSDSQPHAAKALLAAAQPQVSMAMLMSIWA